MFAGSSRFLKIKARFRFLILAQWLLYCQPMAITSSP